MFSVVPYYYLELLIEKSPVTIYDIGCGWNIFKKYTPNIIGISAEPPDSPIFFADIHDFVDDEFVAGHQEYFESAFSINALHFHSLTKLSKVIKDFVSMIQSGGRGFLALNAQRMIERLTSDEIIKLFGTASPTKEQYTDFILECIGTVDCHFLIVDVDLSKLDDTLDGNIRIVFERIYK